MALVTLLSLAGTCSAGGLDSYGFWGSAKISRIPISILSKSITSKRAEELVSPNFRFSCAGRQYTAVTTLDSRLQSYLDSMMPDALGQVTAIVCMDPLSGRVLAMSGFDRTRPGSHVWTEKLIPSASIFKIITAAGAIEFLHMRPETKLQYLGGKHTLYKYQLREKRGRHVNTVTLKEAFSQSINPVFGKLGSRYLGDRRLRDMATRFFWLKEIPFEILVKKSTIKVTNDSFNMAEIASGFNRDTKITALHGALIVSSIANRGIMMAPSFIDTIKGRDGEVVYLRRIYPLTRPVNPKTADMLFTMMQATIKKGTARRAFSGYTRDRVLKRLQIGGKTGTIDNHNHELRYDWFCGVAMDKITGRSMAVGVVVGHKDVLGTRAASYARLAFKKYFNGKK